MKITLNNAKGKILKTAKTVIREDIEVVPALEKKEINANGNYTVGDGYAGIGEVVVSVSGKSSWSGVFSDERTYFVGEVVYYEGGIYERTKYSTMVQLPTNTEYWKTLAIVVGGTKEIHANGTYNITDFASVKVNVPTGSGEDIPDHTESDFTLQLANTASGELGVVYSSTEKVAFEAAPSGKVIDTFVDTNFVPGNIKKDVEIFGVTGEYEGEGEVIPEFTEVEDFAVYVESDGDGSLLVGYDVSQKVALPAGSPARLASLSDEDFIADNIRKGKNIFGLEGAFEGGGGATPTQEKSVTITDNGTTEVLPDAGYALSKVTINANVKQNYCLVRFYNDDRTTLLYEVLVPYGSSAVYAGDAPVSSLGADYTFTGFEPSTDNVTADMDCYAVYDEPAAPELPDEVGTLESTSWADISAISAAGTAANYFAVGDRKAVALNGKVGEADINETYDVYILGFDHNSELEGKGIHFGTFKTADGTNIALSAGYATNLTNGTKYSNVNHWGGYNHGGWAGSDVRYDILGSTDVAPSGYGAAAANYRTGYDATATCATNPVANTLMSALPADLRAVMKPMTKYTDNVGGGKQEEAEVTATIDYLPLLAEFEVFGVRKSANRYEENKQAQYAYYAAGNPKGNYRANSPDQTANTWLRSAGGGSASWCINNFKGEAATSTAEYAWGVASVFKV